MIGIYCFTNKINNKKYVGQSIDILLRREQHFWAAYNIKTREYNTYFHKAIRKYGQNNFIFEILEECKVDDLDEKEIKWISYYKSNNSEFGYNLTFGGKPLNSSHSLKIYQYDKNGKLLAEFENAYDAARQLGEGFYQSSIWSCASHYKAKSVKGFIFAYEGDDLSWHFNLKINKRAVVQLDKNNNIINTFSSLKEAARAVNGNSSNIRKVLQGKRKSSSGYYWKEV
jgi:hypothetical protein